MGLNSKTSMHTDISSNKMACLKQNTDMTHHCLLV